MSKHMNYWSVSSQILKEEAELLGLKVEIIVPDKNLFLVKSKDKEILFKSTDFGINTSLGLKIADDKELTYSILERNGLPIAKTVYIYENELEEFDWSKINNFKFPVIIKPVDEDHGNGVCMNIITIPELKKKLELSFEFYSKMIIQEQITGDECRVLVVMGEVILALRRIPPFITGDGIKTIKELIEIENSTNPLRKQNYSAPLGTIKADSELIDYIDKQGFNLESIIPVNIKLQLRGNSNIGSGGTIEEVTNILHESTKKICIKATEKAGLGMCGVDILTSDFSMPLVDTGGIILELNATPGLGGDRELTSVNSGREILKKIFNII
ncbi:MAG: hypothetical protein PHZ26_04410 [Candidatus Gracilibacteria bacterium]|nr:hypothetical protein [Candidatus Gracilibacteria bacterium]MDD2908971.1 hypothetical protein [Candidatus Gracilibacteria bacterium]